MYTKYCLTQGWDVTKMSNVTMMELSKELDEQFDRLLNECMVSGEIDQELYTEYDVKRGLRDANGKGVLTGLTEISDVLSYKSVDGKKMPADGELYFQGYNVKDLIAGFEDRRYGFEETTYLLLFGSLPTPKQLRSFVRIIKSLQELSGQFLRDVVMKATNKNQMNALQRCILTLYCYDANPDEVTVPNVLRQSLQLIAKMPQIAVHSYCAYRHFHADDTLVIRLPNKEMSIAENILQMLRPDGEFTELEAKVLDVALVLHAEHGGGNNSTFTCRVLTSSGTDFYSAIAGATGSLKGYRHGGANIKVAQMLKTIRREVKDWDNEAQIKDCLRRIVRKETGDRSGLIYGMGHAVYTMSDPRAQVLKEFSRNLAKEKGMEAELNLIESVEKLSKEVFAEEKKSQKQICANVDLYSGFVYKMLGIPEDIFTPLFAASRMPGWCAHRVEECCSPDARIIRPAYRNVSQKKKFLALTSR